MLAHNATILSIPFDPAVLFNPPDPYYVTWFGSLVDEVGMTRERQRREREAEANS